MNILKITRLTALLILLLTGVSLSRKVVAQPGFSIPVESFYDELGPYGQWMQYPGYDYVWQPDVGPDFQPYASAGHWVYTDYGNTWVSDYSWGWAPFHYGRWLFDQGYGGWLWVPGSDWAPAWVDWRSGGGYYGWAPLGPNWGPRVYGNLPAPFWTFVPQGYITSPYIYNYYVPRPNVVNIYQRTTAINNVYRSNNWAYNYGPPRGDIERITHRPVEVYRIDRVDRPGRAVVGNGSVGFYHPGSGAVRRDGPGYNRNDRFDNSGRPNYGGNVPSNQGSYYGNNNAPRNYPGNTNVPRNYPGNMNNPERSSYGSNAPASPNGGFNTPVAPVAPSSPQVNRPFDGSRGSYQPGNAPQGGYSPGNTPPSISGEQNNGGFQRGEGRGGFGQTQAPNQGQAPGARSGNGNSSNPFGGERGGRGPR